jgi:hypothetical protein
MGHGHLSFAVLFVTLIVSSSGRANGQTPAAGGAARSDAPRIAYVNIQTVAAQSALGKQFRARIEDRTSYTLTVMLSGPTIRKLTLAPSAIRRVFM